MEKLDVRKRMTKLNPQMTMVVARYNENLDWLKSVPWNYIVFNKGEDNLPKWIKNEIKLPNIGREAHTYLIYIIDNYDNLPDFCIFVQGNPFEHSKQLLEKMTRFDGRVNFFTLSDRTLSSRRYGTLTRAGHKVAQSARKIFVDEINSFSFPKGAQFILSRKAVLFHTKLTYQKLVDFMTERISTNEVCLAHRRGCARNCEYKRPFSAWVMERLWITLFDNKHKTIYD